MPNGGRIRMVRPSGDIVQSYPSQEEGNGGSMFPNPMNPYPGLPKDMADELAKRYPMKMVDTPYPIQTTDTMNPMEGKKTSSKILNKVMPVKADNGMTMLPVDPSNPYAGAWSNPQQGLNVNDNANGLNAARPMPKQGGYQAAQGPAYQTAFPDSTTPDDGGGGSNVHWNNQFNSAHSGNLANIDTANGVANIFQTGAAAMRDTVKKDNQNRNVYAYNPNRNGNGTQAIYADGGPITNEERDAWERMQSGAHQQGFTGDDHNQQPGVDLMKQYGVDPARLPAYQADFQALQGTTPIGNVGRTSSGSEGYSGSDNFFGHKTAQQRYTHYQTEHYDSHGKLVPEDSKDFGTNVDAAMAVTNKWQADKSNGMEGYGNDANLIKPNSAGFSGSGAAPMPITKPLGLQSNGFPTEAEAKSKARVQKPNWHTDEADEAKSGIHIKPQNKGKFTAYKKRTGKTTAEALHSKDPHVRQMANFARNASHFKHENGGSIEEFGDGGKWETNNKATISEQQIRGVSAPPQPTFEGHRLTPTPYESESDKKIRELRERQANTPAIGAKATWQQKVKNSAVLNPGRYLPSGALQDVVGTVADMAVYPGKAATNLTQPGQYFQGADGNSQAGAIGFGNMMMDIGAVAAPFMKGRTPIEEPPNGGGFPASYIRNNPTGGTRMPTLTEGIDPRSLTKEQQILQSYGLDPNKSKLPDYFNHTINRNGDPIRIGSDEANEFYASQGLERYSQNPDARRQLIGNQYLQDISREGKSDASYYHKYEGYKGNTWDGMEVHRDLMVNDMKNKKFLSNEYGGNIGSYKAGQEVDLSEAQIKHLKSLGYGIEVC